ncbi:dimethylaniline monooxygenase [N-oxide-forming] 2-like [Clavelina lepadiformis]|uniref:dimethylaniline monooxygenase [N-oxide-forming] 2-like n=1 Tax=Clavelina lepadiformis TaxID=159417 RepID=UPI0040427804
MGDKSKKVCVIGAGISGLAAIKACLEEGLTPTCYEKLDFVGGMWNDHNKEKHDNSPTTYASLVTNISRVNLGFSDFPAPKGWPPYINRYQVGEYAEMYADHFGLKECIRFKTEIVSVTPAKSYSKTGSWLVKVKDLNNDEISFSEFDAVIVACGQYNKKIKSSVPGLDKDFAGSVFHGGDYRGPEKFKDKSVLVIGAGYTGSDIACESTRTAKNVFLCARNGTWIVPRVSVMGTPFDLIFNRLGLLMERWLPSWWTNWTFENIVGSRVDHEACGIKSRYPYMNMLRSTTISDELPLKIYSGQVKIRRAIKQITGNTVTYVDGREDFVDTVVLATGYTPYYPFLSEEIFPSELGEARLYKWIFPFKLQQPSTLSFVGIGANAAGGITPVVEMQARYVARVLSGKKELPSKEEMQKTWTETREELLQSTGGKFEFRTNLFHYQEDLAQDLGLVPSFLKLLLTDPKLAYMYYLGPVVPYHYRLVGDHSWDKARERSLNIMDEALSGMR